MKLYSTLHAAAVDLPVDVATFKSFVRQFASHEDDLIARLLDAAAREAQLYVQRSLERQSRIACVNGTPPRTLELDMGPVLSITSVKYYRAADAVLTTLDPSTYVLERDVLYPASGLEWPAVSTDVLAGFQVVYVAGSSDHTVSPAVELDAQLATAVMLLAQATYHRRTDCRDAAYVMLDTLRDGQGV